MSEDTSAERPASAEKLPDPEEAPTPAMSTPAGYAPLASPSTPALQRVGAKSAAAARSAYRSVRAAVSGLAADVAADAATSQHSALRASAFSILDVYHGSNEVRVDAMGCVWMR